MAGLRDSWWEIGLLGLLGLWSTVSIGCVFGIPFLSRWPARLGRIHLFDDWTMFGTGGGAAVGSRTWFEFREFSPAGTPSAWTKFADTGDAWVWHAFIWLPRRRLTDRLRILAKEIRQHALAQPPLPKSLARLSGVAADHLQVCHPGAPGTRRQIRIVTEPWHALGAAAGDETNGRRFVELEPFRVETAGAAPSP